MSMDVFAKIPSYSFATGKAVASYPKLVDVSFTPEGNYAAVLDDFDAERGDHVGSGPDAWIAVYDLCQQQLDTKLDGRQLAALEGYLTQICDTRPESEREGFLRCISEVLEVFG